MADKYWVSGAGDWSDTDHWSDSSGGASGDPVPNSTDWIFFDSSSGLSAGNVVNMDTAGAGAYLDCSTGVGFTISGANTLTIGSSGAGFESSMTISCALSFGGSCTFGSSSTVSSAITFTGTGGFDSGGNTLSGALVFDNGSDVDLDSDLDTTGAVSIGGTFSLDNFDFTTTADIVLALEGDASISFGSGTIEAKSWGDEPVNTVSITGGTGTLKLINNTATVVNFDDGGSNTYYNLWLTGTGAGGFNIKNANTFNEIKIDGASKSVYFDDGQTQTVSSFVATGTSSITYTLTKLGSSAWTISKSSGTVQCDYLDLSYSTATGGATWQAGSNSTDSGNNTNWAFITGTVTNDERQADLRGAIVISDTRSGTLTGGIKSTDTRSVFLHGKIITDSERAVYLFGQDDIWEAVAKPTTSYTAVAKPTTSWSK